MKPLFARFRVSKPSRAWKRYSEARGNILAAGVGYFAFFSIFPAAALALTVFGFVLHGHPQLLQSVFDHLGAYLPGLIRDVQHPKGLIPVQAPQATALTIAGLIALLTLVLAGLGWLGAIREGIRAVFGVHGSGGSLISNKLRDLVVLFTLGLGIALVAVLTSSVGVAAGLIAQWIGMSGKGGVLIVVGLVVSVLADTGLMIVMLRVVSGVPFSWRILFQGSLVGGVGLSVLKMSAASLLPRLTANPLFASFAIVVGLLVWLNLVARLILVAAAWAANDVDGVTVGDVSGQVQSLRPLPDTAEMVGTLESVALRDSSLPTFDGRSGDRTTLGAGIILGAAAMAATAALVRGTRSALRLVRG